MALSGGSNRATTLFLNASPYRAIFHPYRPQVQDYIGATTILTRGALFFLLSACQPEAKDKATQANQEQKKMVGMTDKVREQLRDPESAQFRNLHWGSRDKEGLCGEVNAKNHFGGYVGFRPFVVVKGEKGNSEVAVDYRSDDTLTKPPFFNILEPLSDRTGC